MREVIIDLGITKPVFTLDEVVTASESEGNSAKAESISSILSRMKREGVVRGVRRGVYALERPEAPDESGASVTTNTSAVDAAGPDPRGGDGDGDHHRDHSAPVTGSD